MNACTVSRVPGNVLPGIAGLVPIRERVVSVTSLPQRGSSGVVGAITREDERLAACRRSRPSILKRRVTFASSSNDFISEITPPTNNYTQKKSQSIPLRSILQSSIMTSTPLLSGSLATSGGSPTVDLGSAVTGVGSLAASGGSTSMSLLSQPSSAELASSSLQFNQSPTLQFEQSPSMRGTSSSRQSIPVSFEPFGELNQESVSLRQATVQPFSELNQESVSLRQATVQPSLRQATVIL